MLIQCTAALIKELGKKPKELVSAEVGQQFPDYFMAWHANIIRMNRRKTIVLMNNATRYPIVLYGLRKADFARIEELIVEAIIEVMQLEGIDQSIIDLYVEQMGDIQYSKTENRTMTSWLNNTIREVGLMGDYLNTESTTQKYLSIPTSRLLQKFFDEDYEYPFVKMHENLHRLYEEIHQESLSESEVIKVPIYELDIQLEMAGHEIWRRVQVPATFSFRHLHFVIQTVFDWHNSHLHEFTIHREKTKHLAILMDDDPETLYYVDTDRFEVCNGRFTSLSEIFSQNDTLSYMYDFGDSWHHIITLQNVSESNELRATFVEGKGERPPEDVGGEGGFAHYLEILNDKNHPEYEDTVVWADEQRERRLTDHQINARLKSVLSPGGYSYYLPYTLEN